MQLVSQTRQRPLVPQVRRDDDAGQEDGFVRGQLG